MIKKDSKVALTCGIQNENEYINEYVEHYLNIGFNHIILLVNDYPSNIPVLQDILQPYLKTHVTLDETYAGSADRNRQWNGYNYSYYKYGKFYDWMAFFDADEFLFLNKHDTIQEYLASDPIYKFNYIKFNWRLMSDNGQIYKQPGKVTERFTEYVENPPSMIRRRSENTHTKAMVKTKQEIMFRHPHYCLMNRSKCITGSGLEAYASTPFTDAPDYDMAELRHYWSKSTEEFCNRRLTRTQMYDGVKEDVDKDVNRYFMWNERTPEKENFIKEFRQQHNI